MLGKGAVGDVRFFLAAWLIRAPFPLCANPIPDSTVVSGAAGVGAPLLLLLRLRLRP